MTRKIIDRDNFIKELNDAIYYGHLPEKHREAIMDVFDEAVE